MGKSSFYDRHILPHVIGCACSTKPVMKQRAKVVPLATGRVLELGIGGGLNLAFYDPSKVSEVHGIDPSPELRERARTAPRPPGLEVHMHTGGAEALPFEEASFDTVVCTYTLCSVQSPRRVLTQAARVLRPGGRLLFCEHGLAPDPGVAKWQARIEPIWKPLAGGCHLTRPVVASLTAAGLVIEQSDSMYIPGAPKVLGWNEWGIARAA